MSEVPNKNKAKICYVPEVLIYPYFEITRFAAQMCSKSSGKKQVPNHQKEIKFQCNRVSTKFSTKSHAHNAHRAEILNNIISEVPNKNKAKTMLQKLDLTTVTK
ncbi:hypothetical protein TNIN_131381 [Trichonephila inaurata madagascariensis]|uniref:Uncharacterized protein n=1 Tax=Trichonephila inaurata madagascariensis TaxID=2747483 RepID=A0A8X7C1X0_9ARAC|nr:hypothetical protein TNIN_131381 [Trichonephila inaurata madagascariensis]